MTPGQTIEAGRAYLGIEFGSTRIKAVLIDGDANPIAQGNHEWENSFEDGLWTYSLDDIIGGLQSCYAALRADVKARHSVEINRLGAIGISGMMHGYLAFDSEGRQLTPFRTWRNTNTGGAASRLSNEFEFNIPLRWTIAHYYQALIDDEPHTASIDFLTTLAGYVHFRLTGKKVVGVGEASGIMPVDSLTMTYDARMVERFETLTGRKGLLHLLPRVLTAGEEAGVLTQEGALLLDPSGTLRPGAPLCPPEGDAGTGMVATNAIRPRTGNVSAGTSAFSMIVLDRSLSRPYPDIDMVTTPVGDPVAMVHCNNCTSELNAWAGIFREFGRLMGCDAVPGEVFGKLYTHALESDPDAGGIMAYNFLSGEPIAEIGEGRPMTMRSVESRMNLSNFIRAQLYSAVACLSIGNELLFKEEKITVDRMTGHGGFFKTPVVGQRIMAAALGTPVSVMQTAGEGGAWGMAILAAYMADNAEGLSLADYLEKVVFRGDTGSCIEPDPADVEGFRAFLKEYRRLLPVERQAASLPS